MSGEFIAAIFLVLVVLFLTHLPAVAPGQLVFDRERLVGRSSYLWDWGRGTD
ncbi:hypothetical protein BDV26DRAFT_254110 [Aspergillus bertholletiae]|uniref:Uncharacterized protein n=1 Tax=Aspergillus bertholletiae TaxID=1226010 RepID=A0A5N7BKA7_9EURO|nr:hypothetical protein BDV26DRAFT_254110 [Aspergillus bertholletiae]